MLRTYRSRVAVNERREHTRHHYPPAITHYERLGVATSASADEIHAAYRQCARELHPDARAAAGANADAEAMAAVNEAWRVLSDAGRRRQYDTSIGVGVQHPPAAAPAPPPGPAYAFVDAEDDAFDPIGLFEPPVGPMEARGTRHVALMLSATLVVMGVFVIGLFVYAFFRSGTLFP